ncbi:MAG: hypothetical protein IPP34_15320 [Bacteroidetes bacterium]|nr:hypothetical protein [Bacteroidota bacterium]
MAILLFVPGHHKHIRFQQCRELTYIWTLPVGWTGTSNGTTITVTPGTGGGTISVAANNTHVDRGRFVLWLYPLEHYLPNHRQLQLQVAQ